MQAKADKHALQISRRYNEVDAVPPRNWWVNVCRWEADAYKQRKYAHICMFK